MKNKTEAKLKYVGKCLLIEEGKEKLLVVGDLHLGYEELLNKSGIMISRQMFDEIINDFNAVFGEVGHVDKIVLLGDIKHDFGGISGQEWGDVTRLLHYLKPLGDEIIVLRGNHDTILEPIMKKIGLKLKDYYVWKEFCFVHGDEDFKEIWGKKVKWFVVGHGHPAIKLREGSKMESQADGCLRHFSIVPPPGRQDGDDRENRPAGHLLFSLIFIIMTVALSAIDFFNDVL